MTRGTGARLSSAAVSRGQSLHEFFFGRKCAAQSQLCGSGWSAAGTGSLVSPGHWSALSLTASPSDKPGRNPSVSSEEQEEERLQASVFSSLHVFLQQQPSQAGHFPAVTAPAFLGSGRAGRPQHGACLPGAWHKAMRNQRCAGGYLQSTHAALWVR